MLRGDYERDVAPVPHRQQLPADGRSSSSSAGFDESFKRAEDDELALRLHDVGCVFHFEPEAIAWHYSNRSLRVVAGDPRGRTPTTTSRSTGLHPRRGYLADKKRELADAPLPLRAARRVFGGRRTPARRRRCGRGRRAALPGRARRPRRWAR